MTTKSTEAPLAGDASEDTKSSEAYPGEAFYRREARLKHALDEATRRREEELYRLETERIRREIEKERREIENERREIEKECREIENERRRVENELREIENELRRVASIREEGIELGRVRQQRTSILTLLTKRFGSVDTAIEEALGDKTDMGELERLLLTAAMCGSLDEFKASL